MTWTFDHLVYEDPKWICIGCGVLLLIAIVVWQNMRSKIALGFMIGMPLLAGIVFVAALVVDTDKERIEKTWGRLSQAIIAQKAADVETFLAEDFRGDGLNKQKVMQMLEQAFKSMGPETVTFNLQEVQVISGGEKGVARIMVAARYSNPPIDTRWELALQSFMGVKGREWQVVKVTGRNPKNGLTLGSALEGVAIMKNLKR